MASWNEGAYRGGMLPGGGDPNSLEERKKQLLQWLAGRGATQAGFRGTAVGRMGGIGGRGPLPGLQYNPFLSQIAGRSGEQFNNFPAGISQAAAHIAQTGPLSPGQGLVNPMGGGNIGPDAAPGVVQPQGGAAGRNLIGMPPPPAALGSPLAVTAPQLQPYDPYRLARMQTRGTFRE